jgi:Putative metallopeptidase
MNPTCRGASIQERPRPLLLRNQRPSQLRSVATSGLRGPRGSLSLAPQRSMGWLLSLICMLAFAIPQTPAHAAEAHPNRMQVEYVPPTNPDHQALYERLKERRALEKLQEIFSPLRLPVDLTLRTVGCSGVSNAWYGQTEHQVSVCYEYLNEIHQLMPKETTPEGVTPIDAVMGQHFYVFAHEMGHAMFDILDVPVFGNAEDAADHFATYIMLQFGKDQSRALITGAAYSYKKYVQGSEVTAPLAAFSDVHAAPAQRFYNMLCLAYGADPILFADFVTGDTKDYLPKGRAHNCKREYDQVTFAFRDVIVPHLDRQMEKQVMDKTWLPDVKGRPSHK